jgi:hypothetical protein
MGLIPILLIVVIILLLSRSKGRPFHISRGSADARDPVHLKTARGRGVLLAGLLVNLAAPLGTYWLW